MCSAISYPVAAFISIKYSSSLCPSFNLKAFERELLYEIWPYGGSFIICPSAYNPIYSSFHSFCVKLHLYNAVRQYESFGQQPLSMKLISSSQGLRSMYEVWSCVLDVWSLLPFGTRWITTTKVVFGHSGWLYLGFWPAGFPKSVAGRLLPRLPFFLASQTPLLHSLEHFSTYCHRIHSVV